MRLDLCRIPAASASMARGRARVNPRLLVRRGRRLMLTATQLFGWA
jgi:DNA-binding transcriptional LysR family regulator